MFFALFLLYATRSLDVRPATLGVVLGAASVGTLLGSFVTARIGRRLGIGPAFLIGCVLFPAPLILVPAAGGPHWLVFACLFTAEFLSGIGLMLLDIMAGTISAATMPADAALAGVGRVHGRQQRRPPARHDGRRNSRHDDRRAPDVVDRNRRRALRDASSAVADPLAARRPGEARNDDPSSSSTNGSGPDGDRDRDADGRPSVRMLLLKSATSGLHVLHRLHVAQGGELEANPRARCSSTGRDPGARRGPRRAAAGEESDAYWATRPAVATSAAASNSRSRSPPATLEAAAPRSPRTAAPERWGGYRCPGHVRVLAAPRRPLHERHLFGHATSGNRYFFSREAARRRSRARAHGRTRSVAALGGCPCSPPRAWNQRSTGCRSLRLGTLIARSGSTRRARDFGTASTTARASASRTSSCTEDDAEVARDVRLRETRATRARTRFRPACRSRARPRTRTTATATR